jgi:phospholipid-binding lipoprotein MlaA
MPMKMPPVFAAAAVVWLVAGCAGDSVNTGTPDDPYESTNRSFFNSHQALYRSVIRPVTNLYVDAVPEPARDGIHNALTNADLPVTIVNDVLQGEIVGSGETVARLAVNTTVGIGGFINVARWIGIPEHETDFGDTLAAYGVGEGPYLYLPVLGPTVPRELAGKVVDTFFDPLFYVTYANSIFVSIGRDGATYADKRARAIATTDEIDKVSDDPYAVTRLLYQKHLEAEANHTDIDSDFDDQPENVRLAAQEVAAAEGTAVASDGAFVAPAASPTNDAYCATLAQSRADDADANGIDADEQQAVHDGTYKDCMTWKTAHNG